MCCLLESTIIEKADNVSWNLQFLIVPISSYGYREKTRLPYLLNETTVVKQTLKSRKGGTTQKYMFNCYVK